MLPMFDVTQAPGQAGGAGGSRGLAHAAPRSHAAAASAAARGPHGGHVGGHGPLAGARAAPLPIAAKRRGAPPGAAAVASAASAGTALAQATPDTASCLSRTVLDFGYDKHIEDRYEWGRELGKGGNGVVRVVTDRATGEQHACKALPKQLPAGAAASDAKRSGHVDAIKREVDVMRRLSGSLAVVRLVDVYEDDDYVYIVQELCGGGELHHRIGDRHYSERTVASYMRAVLRTLAQCHSHRILHRDIKPGNFMLLDDSERSPLKAIDFGLAVPYDADQLPRTDLGFEGTPWYMAPEVLSSQVLPASDVWSAGVMAHQLLTGRLPFDDHRNPVAPSISAVWKSVLCDKVNYNMPWWAGVSDEAKDFVNSLLHRDPAKRPTAKEALKHPWLRGDSSERSAGKQIDLSVVARIQRFAQASHFKRGVLQLIAEELLSRPGAAAALGASVAAQQPQHHDGPCDGSVRSAGGSGRGADRPDGSVRSGGSGRGGVSGAEAGVLRDLVRRLQLDGGGAGAAAGAAVDAAAAADALTKMGFRLRPSEAAQLVDHLDLSQSGRVRRSALAASQIDWRRLQQADVSAWIDIARRAFSALDKDADGVLSADEIVASLRAKLPEDELAATLDRVAAEAGAGAGGLAPGGGGLDFEAFLNMLKVGSVDSLDQYDGRYDLPSPGSRGSLDRLQSLLDASHHGSSASADGSSHRGRPGGPRRGAGAGGLLGEASAAAAAAPSPAPAADFRDATWNQPAPNFRFNFGGWEAPAAAAPGGDKPAPAAAPAPPAEPRAWPAAPAPAAPRGGPMLAPMANGTVRAGGHFDKRMHGASLYRNMLVNPGHHHHGPATAAAAAAALPTVAE